MRKEILGCPVDSLTLDEMVDHVERLVASGGQHYGVSINVDKVVEAERDPSLREIMSSSALNNADGMPVVWASRMLRRPIKQRVAGIDLFEALLARAAQRGWGVYLLGARPAVVAKAKAELESRYPGLRVVGARDGYWAADEEPEVVAGIAATAPDLLFIAFGSPRKELFIARHLQHMRVGFAMGVGGTFDVVAGITDRAPRWMQRLGLEWFYRFAQEPLRLGPRYFGKDMRFFVLLGRELLGRAAARRAT